MGVLTDLVVADPQDARQVCESNCPSEEFNGLEARGIDTVKLGTLYQVLTDTDYDPEFFGDALCSGSEEGPWVFEVPPRLVKGLGALDAAQIHDVGAKWAATEEFSPKYDNWPEEAVHELLADLVALCRRATDQHTGVLMWMSL